jgi:hypothetical protein
VKYVIVLILLVLSLGVAFFISPTPAKAEIVAITFVPTEFSNELWAIYQVTVYVYGDEPVTCIGRATSFDETQDVFNFTLDLSIPTGFATQADFGDYFYYVECNTIPYGSYVYPDGRQTSVNFRLVRVVMPSPTEVIDSTSIQIETVDPRPIPTCDWGVVFVFWYQGEGLAVYRGNDHGTADQLIGLWIETENVEAPQTLATSEDGTIIVSRLDTGEIQVNYTIEDSACVINPETRLSYRVPVSS